RRPIGPASRDFFLGPRPPAVWWHVANRRGDGEFQRVGDFRIPRAAVAGAGRRATLGDDGTVEDTYQADDQQSSHHIRPRGNRPSKHYPRSSSPESTRIFEGPSAASWCGAASFVAWPTVFVTEPRTLPVRRRRAKAIVASREDTRAALQALICLRFQQTPSAHLIPQDR